MKSSHFLTAVVASLAAICAVVGHAAPANVVFGNLGPNATGNISATSTTLSGSSLLSQGFTTGTSDFSLNSIVLGLAASAGGSGTTSATVSLFANSGNAPAGSALWTSNPTSVDAAQRWSFTGPAFTLSANSSYWIVPSTGADWYTNQTFSAPTEQNSSGFSYFGTVQSTNGGTSWTAFGLNSEAVSVQAVAVPEPSTYALSAIGVIATGVMQWRRRAARKSAC